MTTLVKETKELIEDLPQDRLKIAWSFLQWLSEEELTQKEKKVITQSRKEISQGNYINWRDFATTNI